MPDEKADKPRAFWSGTITFGLVSVPVNLFPANRSGGVHWRMLDEDGTPLRRRFFCPAEEREVGPDEIVRGYEISEGEYVVVTDEELERLEPRKSRDIDLRAFVDEDEIEPLYFERSYFLTPADDATKAYRLLAAVMEREHQAGIATFVMRDKEYLVAILSERGILRAETLRFQDEVRKPSAVGLTKAPKAEAHRVRHVVEQIDRLTEPKLKPSFLKNEHAERLEELIERKKKQHRDTVHVETAEPDEEGEIDLVAVLKRSLAGGTTKRPAGGTKRKSAKRTVTGRGRSPARPRRKSA